VLILYSAKIIKKYQLGFVCKVESGYPSKRSFFQNTKSVILVCKILIFNILTFLILRTKMAFLALLDDVKCNITTNKNRPELTSGRLYHFVSYEAYASIVTGF